MNEEDDEEKLIFKNGGYRKEIVREKRVWRRGKRIVRKQLLLLVTIAFFICFIFVPNVKH